jgi:hypothetical protein
MSGILHVVRFVWSGRLRACCARPGISGEARSTRAGTRFSAAEGVGFEPTVGLHLLRFSRPSQSTTLAPLRFNRHVEAFKSYRDAIYWLTSSMMSSATKIGTSTVTARAIASLGRESTSTSSPSWRIRSLAK